MVNKWRDARNNKNMKKVHKVATHSVTRILTQYSIQGSALSALVVYLIYSATEGCRYKKWVASICSV